MAIAQWTFSDREKWYELQRKEANGVTLTEQENEFCWDMLRLEKQDYYAECDYDE